LVVLAGTDEALAGDNAELISVSIPSNTQELPKSTFTQTWTLQNTGTTTWTPGQSGYVLKLASWDTLGAVPLFANTSSAWHTPPTAIIGNGATIVPGARGTFSMSFIAPETAGSYTDTFQMFNSNGVAFGPAVTVQIIIPPGGATNLFDRSRAVSYANNYDGYVVTDGYFWTNGSDYHYYGALAPVPTNLIGDDCAHFVSSCIGRQPNHWGGGINVPTRVPPTYGEPGAGRLVNTVLIAAGYATEVFSLSEMSPGDVVGWNWEGDTNIEDLDHVTLYVGNGLLASHAVSALDVSADTFFQDGAPDYVRHLIHIFDAPTILQSPQLNPSGEFTFTLTGNPGANYTIQCSTNLVIWTPVSTASNITGSIQFFTGNSPVSNGGYYYRAVMSH